MRWKEGRERREIKKEEKEGIERNERKMGER
jgi:hypothetical protein